MKVEFFSQRDSPTYYHVLFDGDTVGNINQYHNGWKFTQNVVMLGGRYTAAQLAEITAAAKEKNSSSTLPGDY